MPPSASARRRDLGGLVQRHAHAHRDLGARPRVRLRLEQLPDVGVAAPVAARLDVLAEPHVFHVVVAGRVGRHEGLDVPVPLGPQRVDAEDLLELGPIDKPALPSIVLGPVRSQQDLPRHAALDRRERAAARSRPSPRARAAAAASPLLFRELRAAAASRRTSAASRAAPWRARRPSPSPVRSSTHVLITCSRYFVPGQRVALEVGRFKRRNFFSTSMCLRPSLVSPRGAPRGFEFRERQSRRSEAILGEIEAMQAKVLV